MKVVVACHAWEVAHEGLGILYYNLSESRVNNSRILRYIKMNHFWHRWPLNNL